MKTPCALLLLLSALPLTAEPTERLGTVAFPTSCASASQASFNRGVALLHDFWYSEARNQFQQISKSDAGCAMAHWGLAMSTFHQIWGRPDAESMKLGWEEMQKAQALTSDQREQAYIMALADFYRPGAAQFPARIEAYSKAMAKLYKQDPDDVDAGAFYALSILAAHAPDDASVEPERKAMTVLTPLFARYPDNPGVVHYIIHSCDNPALAADGLAAADHYGEIASSGPHAFHMPGHIYARLGLWPKDIASQLGSIKAAEAAETRGMSGLMDEPHSYDFLLYAYLQSGQDARAKETLEHSSDPLTKIESMPGMGGGHMEGMVPYYRMKLPIFYALEMRDWNAAAKIKDQASAPPHVSTLLYWARAVADGHLRHPAQARTDLARYDALVVKIKQGKYAFLAEDTGFKIERNEMLAWALFAEGKQDSALQTMRTAADLQDKVGQGEVDIPAREMLADMLLEFGRAKEAVAEYDVALKLSPNRLNGLYNAGRAAEASGDKLKAGLYYERLLKVTDNGENSVRPEIARAKSFVSGVQSSSALKK